MSKKVLIGFSGGVDSAVAAYLLKKEGYEVTACFMRNWDSIVNNDIRGNPTLNLKKCSQELDYDDATLAAKELGITLLRIDFVKEYWDEVFSYFLKEYAKGRTPNPDVFCNKYIKFEAFRQFAKERGFDYIAMGHYAKRVDEGDKTCLYKAVDKNKDQSYFLAQISKEQLKSCLFPLSELTKPEVREIATKLGLTLANKRDSTGVCFIGERNFKNFLSNYLPAMEGDIIDIGTGKKIGRHEGVYYHTIGQRKGLGIGGKDCAKNGPLFVVGKDARRNLLFVGHEPNKYMYSYKARLTNINWLDEKIPEEKIICKAKFRYRASDQEVVALIKEDEAILEYQGYKYITPGQLAVLYSGDKLLGSGIIDELFDEEGNKIDFQEFVV